jgi:hypothetical protein
MKSCIDPDILRRVVGPSRRHLEPDQVPLRGDWKDNFEVSRWAIFSIAAAY